MFKGGLYSVTPCCRHWQLPLWPLTQCRQPRSATLFFLTGLGSRVPLAGKSRQNIKPNKVFPSNRKKSPALMPHFGFILRQQRATVPCNLVRSRLLGPRPPANHRSSCSAPAQHMSNHWATDTHQKRRRVPRRVFLRERRLARCSVRNEDE